MIYKYNIRTYKIHIKNTTHKQDITNVQLPPQHIHVHKNKRVQPRRSVWEVGPHQLAPAGYSSMH